MSTKSILSGWFPVAGTFPTGRTCSSIRACIYSGKTLLINYLPEAFLRYRFSLGAICVFRAGYAAHEGGVIAFVGEY